MTATTQTAVHRSGLKVKVPTTIQFGRKKLKLLGIGTTRAVYEGKSVVVKVQLDNRYCENTTEALRFKHHGKSPEPRNPSFARCRLLKNGWLVMEKVAPRYNTGRRPPEWGWGFDCCQVGLDKKGRWVAYDYA